MSKFFGEIPFGEYILRDIELRDIPKFIEIRSQCLEELHNDTNYSLESAYLWYGLEKPRYLVIEKNEEIIGYIRTSDWDSRDKCCCVGMDLDIKQRGHRISKEIYYKFMEILKEKFGISRVYLYVLASNFRAVNLYREMGFNICGIRPKQVYRKDGSFMDDIIMWKDIDFR